MEWILQRRPSLDSTTLGELYIDGTKECDTLEDEIREIPGRPVESWKVPRVTAIPAGRYRVTLETSPRFGPRTITFHRVPGYTGIRGHGANRHEDLEGCVTFGLAGTKGKPHIIGGTSLPAVERVAAKLEAALARGEECWCDVRNPTTTAATWAELDRIVAGGT